MLGEARKQYSAAGGAVEERAKTAIGTLEGLFWEMISDDCVGLVLQFRLRRKKRRRKKGPEP